MTTIPTPMMMIGWKQKGGVKQKNQESSGVAGSTLNKFLKIIALVADTLRHRHDEHVRCSISMHRLHNLLKVEKQSAQRIYYICRPQPAADDAENIMKKWKHDVGIGCANWPELGVTDVLPPIRFETRNI
ncbi:hypothetical protein BV898_18563 [Hypsibius exemplaris]|uniref:Uncharacterized protein n=1 Tax=Hypsibius exemplaris TaxID=2072580 RepID=A0A9X6NHH2_HYPEX|nr:hypothetical protein BV898_18563 [Hypsibius exemplaris]